MYSEKILEINGCRFSFVFIPPGEFLMGSDEEELYPEETPVRAVSFVRGFWMGRYPVTKTQWNSLSGEKQELTETDDCPADNISWNRAAEVIGQLNYTADIWMRLPSEAEWEYACRAGTESRFYWGDAPDERYMWWKKNSFEKLHPAGLKLPNQFGLFDMLGNIWEWCEDWYAPDYSHVSSGISPVNLRNPGNGGMKVRRGGSFMDEEKRCRCSSRGRGNPEIFNSFTGIRLVFDL